MLHYRKNLAEKPRLRVLGIKVATLPRAKCLFIQIFPLVAHKTNFCFAFYKTILAPIGRARDALPLGAVPEPVEGATPTAMEA